MTPVTPIAAAVRATTSTRRRSCWMSRWKGQLPPLMPTVRPRLPAPCSGPLETRPARGPRGALPPARQHLLVSESLGFPCVKRLFAFPHDCNVFYFFLYSELYWPDLHRPHQPATLQRHQLECGGCGGGPWGQQLQQLSDICQQPGPGLQHRHKADLWPHESNSQVQPTSLHAVPCCCEAHLPGCCQPAGKIHCHQNTLFE